MINVKSEIKPLKRVLLHRPGKELLNLTPDTLKELLFDDIPYLRIAQREHDAFAQTFRDNGVEVVYLEDLAAEAIRDGEIRNQFIRQYLHEANIDSEEIYHFFNSISDCKELILKTMEGLNSRDLDPHSEARMVIPPMPNLYFTRDSFACIGNGVSLNKMLFTTRQRETIYGEYIFNYHPDYRNVPLYYNRDFPFHIEGGDITNLNDHTLAIGISERTEPDAISLISEKIFESSDIDLILAINIPKKRAYMHLDTVFSQVDYDKFAVHPGIFRKLKVLRITRNGVEEVKDTLEHILADALHLEKVTLIKCGGDDIIASEREQWNDGSNCLCIAPSKVIVYERNEVTNALLRENGIEVIEVAASELSRGRGGPRCMSMPLFRED